jgi:hypothetical protein
MLAWLLGKMRWLLLIAALGGPVMAYFGWADTQRLHNIEANGVEAVAAIEGATRTQRRRGGTSYALNLAWKDAKGAVRQAEKVPVSREFANQIIGDDKIVRASVRIKYLRDDETVTPMVIGDANRHQDLDAFMVRAGVGAGAVGIMGSALMLLMGRRRRTEPAATSQM